MIAVTTATAIAAFTVATAARTFAIANTTAAVVTATLAFYTATTATSSSADHSTNTVTAAIGAVLGTATTEASKPMLPIGTSTGITNTESPQLRTS